ncbi:FtsX-like permease family protein [Flavobacteriaceae bacterium TP-CH-4]|uniref:FtsX-like permease family protein n=1 Tax=Pelagihabitans pacificus TaxID=2696054 RepID=A0A967AT65_9FLAO|nr:ABC transporter permease [Pelagihabitans pacificus]NHF59924.1 FtsX-like permease family protein [Pelagihabitans pacificus]
MLKRRMVLFLRRVQKSRRTFLINFVGLATGLSCVLLVYLWISDELKVDKFHENDHRLVQTMLRHNSGDQINVIFNNSTLLAPVLKDDFPEIEEAVRTVDAVQKSTLSYGDNSINGQGLYADREFFQIFSFHLLHGAKTEVLSGAGNIVISKKLAAKLFGSVEQSLGQSVTFNTSHIFQVSGVFENVPTASTMQFDFVLPFDLLFEHYPFFYEDWSFSFANTFLLLKPETELTAFNKKIENVLEIHEGDETTTLFARPYSERYLYGTYENGVQTGGRIDYVKLFALIGFFILVIACINFVNLSTARASLRMKEVGVRKALGIKRRSLVMQFLIESTLLVALSLAAAIFLTIFLLPAFNRITGKEMTLPINWEIILFGTIITLLTGFIAGIYPAFYISRFKIVNALTGKLKTGVGEFMIRKGLVVFQFTLSIILIIGVLVIYQQLELIQSKNQGFDRENVIYFAMDGKLKTNVETFLSEVKNIPGVKEAASASSGIFGGNGRTSDLHWSGKEEGVELGMRYLVADYNLLEVLDMKMIEGRTFSREYSADSTKIIFNEAAIELMGLQHPVGSTVRLWGEDKEIIGVVQNFHLQSLRDPLAPTFIFLQPDRLHTVMAKLEKEDLNETIGSVAAFYESYNPGFPFEYRFLDEDFQRLYEGENRVSALSKYFAGMAILISCLGLFGLAIFTSERRRKEISIRKVLGQSVAQVTLMLSKEFAKLVVLAILIALPIAYFLSNDWLSGFAYRIPLRLWYFTVAGMVALIIAMLSVGSQAIRAANRNPVNALREE